MVPDFFIVGHPKSGTTALYEMLRQHPAVFMPAMKEPRFFSADLPHRRALGEGGHLPETLHDYLALFTGAETHQRVGEASPSYLYSAVAADAVAAHRPDARIIAILREPCSFLFSFHLDLVRHGIQPERDFVTAVRQEGPPARATGGPYRRTAGRPHYTERTKYVEQLARFKRAFPDDQILVLIYEDFRRDNAQTMRDVFRFLRVADSFSARPVEINPSVAVRFPRLDRGIRAILSDQPPIVRSAKRAAGLVVPAQVRRGGLRHFRRRVVYGPPPTPDGRFVAELRKRFEPGVRELSSYLDRDLMSVWGYGGY